MLHYTQYNCHDKAPWVTLVHGAGGSSSIWYKQIKAFRAHFNILLVDLRGHGRSRLPMPGDLKRYTFDFISREVMEVLDHLRIEKSHFVGISLGTIIIRVLAEQYPERVTGLIMGGATLKMNTQSQVLMRFGVWFKSVIPYILLYKFFAFNIMPRRKHRESRNLFIREARKLYQKEFIRWFKLAAELKPVLRLFRMKEADIPTLYVMGAEDYMFLPTIRKISASHASASLHVIEDCGHVVNVDKPLEFNRAVITFLRQIA